MAAIAASPTSPGSAGASLPLRLPSGWPMGRTQPSAAVRGRRAVVALVAVAALGPLLGAGSLAGAGQAPRPMAPGTASVGATATPAAAASASAVHVVEPGETLWTLARRLQPQGDVRPLVARLQVASGGGPLVPGQRLSLAV